MALWFILQKEFSDMLAYVGLKWPNQQMKPAVLSNENVPHSDSKPPVAFWSPSIAMFCHWKTWLVGRYSIKFLSQSKGLMYFFDNAFERNLVLLERSWGCSHGCSNWHKIIQSFQLCLYCAIVYLASSRLAVGVSFKHSSVYYFCP